VTHLPYRLSITLNIFIFLLTSEFPHSKGIFATLWTPLSQILFENGWSSLHISMNTPFCFLGRTTNPHSTMIDKFSRIIVLRSSLSAISDFFGRLLHLKYINENKDGFYCYTVDFLSIAFGWKGTLHSKILTNHIPAPIYTSDGTFVLLFWPRNP